MNEDDKFWAMMLGENQYIIQEFGTAVIGIGALFFAFAQVSGSFPQLKVGIALIGLGASFVVWMHAWGSHINADSIKASLREMNPELVERYEQVMSWRSQGKRRAFYYPVTALVTYFSALVTLGWVNLLLRVLFNVSFLALLIIDCAAFSVVFLRAITEREKKQSKSDLEGFLTDFANRHGLASLK